jgi:hypothetical protein
MTIAWEEYYLARWISSSLLSRIIEELRKEYVDLFERDIYVPILNLEFTHKEPHKDKELGADFADETERRIREYGLEAVAIYVPFHYTSDWGIYIFEERLNALSYIVSKRLNLHFEDSFLHCERAVREHESFHFQVEYCGTVAETILRRRLYASYRERFKPYNEDEEAIANAAMLTSKPVINIRQELERLCNISPPGYRDYSKYLRGRGLDHERVKKFLSQTLLEKEETILFPTRLEMPSSYRLIPTYYLSLRKAPESIEDGLYFIFANSRVPDVLKKLVKLFPGDIEKIEEGVGREPYHIKLRTGQRIPVPYHGKEGGYVLVKIVNEFADALGKDRREVRELVRKDP